MNTIKVIILFLFFYFIFPKIKFFFINNKIHKKIVNTLDLFFLFRPIMFFVVWPMLCIGMYLNFFSSSLFKREIDLYNVGFDLSTIFLFLGMSCLFSGISILNQIADKESDKINKKLFLMNNKFSDENALKIKNLILLLSSIFLLICNWKVLISGFIIYFFAGYLYNKKPYEFNKKPIYSLICNFITGFLLISSGYIYNVELSKIINFNYFILVIPYLLCYLAVCLLTDIPDIKGDQSYHYNTFAISFGINNTVIISLILVLSSFIYSLTFRDPLASTSIVVCIPFFVYAVFRKFQKDILRAIRYPIAILNLFMMFVYPYLFIGVLIIFYFSKYYYWHRFNLHYPTFLVND